jgi:hypothetical protein
MRKIKMSKYHGMLLFDIADEPIGGWEENLGYRGMVDIWDFYKDGKRTGMWLMVEALDDCDICEEEGKECECHEVCVFDDNTGNVDTLTVEDTYEKAMEFAKTWMKENENGWV